MYSVEPAKSNRAQCKACKIKIDKGVLRVGTTVPGPGDYDMTSWKHLECFKRPSSLQDVSDLSGFAALSRSDAARVEEWWASPTAYAAKRKAEAVQEAVADAQSPPATPVKKSKKAPAAAAAASSTPVKAAAASAELEEEVADREKLTSQFGALPIEKLKNCLRANQQLLAGNKTDLVERCVDRKMYGNLPRCSQCGIGRLKVVYAKPIGHGGQGLFTCPGGYDDDEYKRCSFRSNSVPREPWKQIEDETPQPKAPRKSDGAAGKKSVGSAPASTAAPATASSPAAPSAPAPAAPPSVVIVD